MSRRGISVSSLRPGDCLNGITARAYVVQNSATLRRIELMQGDTATVYDYGQLAEYGQTYLGPGKRRWWHKHLPAFLRRRICEWSRP